MSKSVKWMEKYGDGGKPARRFVKLDDVGYSVHLQTGECIGIAVRFPKGFECVFPDNRAPDLIDKAEYDDGDTLQWVFRVLYDTWLGKDDPNKYGLYAVRTLEEEMA